jgi:UDP-N-acetylenolpyruvoylglucosamine reductase
MRGFIPAVVVGMPVMRVRLFGGGRNRIVHGAGVRRLDAALHQQQEQQQQSRAHARVRAPAGSERTIEIAPHVA